jgi:signal transduction histidine kinase
VRPNPGHALRAQLSRDPGRAEVSKAPASLVHVLAGRDSPAGWHWRTPGERQAAVVIVGVATLVLCIVNVATAHLLAGPHVLLRSPQPLPVSDRRGYLWRDLAAVLAVAPLPLAVRYPLLAWRIGWLALLVVPVVPAAWWGGWPWGPPQLVALLAAFCVAGLRCQRAVLWWMWALTLIPWSLWLHAEVANLNGPVAATIIFTAAVMAIDSLGLRLRAERDLAVQAGQTEAERAQRAVLEERARIARELHDVVAHHMSLIAVQAETAPYRLAGLPEDVCAEFGSLSATAREALSDMRRLLGVLRQDQPASLAPQPQLGDIPSLVDAARRAGVPIQLSVPSAFAPVPSGVGICAYRIVQESLSNASQHAPAAAVTVSVCQDGEAVLVRVSNGPSIPVTDHRGPRGSGHGLAGMRERVALLGGSFSAGPAANGGFEVRATIPLGDTT